MSRRSGAWRRTSCPGPGRARVRAAGRAAAPTRRVRRAARVGLETSGSRARRGADRARLRSLGAPRGRGPGAVGDGADRGRGAARRAVGRGDRHHDEPGRPGDCFARRRSRRIRACAPIWRSWRSWRRGSRGKLSADPARCSPSWAGRARAASPTTRRSPTTGWSGTRSCTGRAGEQSTHGTPRLFEHSFPTPDGRARFVPVDFRPSAEEPDDQYPYRLTTGRVLSQYQSGAQTRRVDALNRAAPEPFVELHPDLARRIGRRGRRAGERDQQARHGHRAGPHQPGDPAGHRVHALSLAGSGRANSVTNPALDPTSKMPEFKTCAVRLEAAGPREGTEG